MSSSYVLLEKKININATCHKMCLHSWRVRIEFKHSYFSSKEYRLSQFVPLQPERNEEKKNNDIVRNKYGHRVYFEAFLEREAVDLRGRAKGCWGQAVWVCSLPPLLISHLSLGYDLNCLYSCMLLPKTGVIIEPTLRASGRIQWVHIGKTFRGLPSMYKVLMTYYLSLSLLTIIITY